MQLIAGGVGQVQIVQAIFLPWQQSIARHQSCQARVLILIYQIQFTCFEQAIDGSIVLYGGIVDEITNHIRILQATEAGNACRLAVTGSVYQRQRQVRGDGTGGDGTEAGITKADASAPGVTSTIVV